MATKEESNPITIPLTPSIEALDNSADARPAPPVGNGATLLELKNVLNARLVQHETRLIELKNIVSAHALDHNSALTNLQGTVNHLFTKKRTVNPSNMKLAEIDQLKYMDIFQRTLDTTTFNYMRYWSQFTAAAFAIHFDDSKEWYVKRNLQEDVAKLLVDDTTSGLSLLSFYGNSDTRASQRKTPLGKACSGIHRLLFQDRIIETRSRIDALSKVDGASNGIKWLSAFGYDDVLPLWINEGFDAINRVGGQATRKRRRGENSAGLDSSSHLRELGKIRHLVIQSSLPKFAEKMLERQKGMLLYGFDRFLFLLYYMKTDEFTAEIPEDKQKDFTIQVKPFPATPDGSSIFKKGGCLHVEPSSEDELGNGANNGLKSRIIKRHEWFNVTLVYYRKVDLTGKSAEEINQLPDKENQLMKTTRFLNLYDVALNFIMEFFLDDFNALFRSCSMAPRAVLVVALAFRCIIQRFFKRTTNRFEEAAALKVCALFQEETGGDDRISLINRDWLSWAKDGTSTEPAGIPILKRNIVASYEEYMKESAPIMEDTSPGEGNSDNTSISDYSHENETAAVTSYGVDREAWKCSAK